MAKRQSIYRIAAERIFEHANTYSCVALEEAHADALLPVTNPFNAEVQLEINRYGSTFSPEVERELFWLHEQDFEEDGHIGHSYCTEAIIREWRITALCFAAAMTKAEMAEITKTSDR